MHEQRSRKVRPRDLQKQQLLIPMTCEDTPPFEEQSAALRNTTTGAQFCVTSSSHLVLSRGRQQAIGRYHLTVMRRGAQATSRADGKQKENKNVTVISDSRLPDVQGRCRPVLPGLKPESQNSVAMASTFDSRCALHANLTWPLILRAWSAEDCDASVPFEKHSVWSSRHTTTRETGVVWTV
jgi:hypothetical protein